MLWRSLALMAAAASAALTQPVARAAEQPPGASQPDAGDQPAFKQEELDQILAPIALYPDSLLSQIFMASTYPLEVVEADRWAKAHKDMKAQGAAQALEEQKWDASVKSLVNFPDVLSMLSEKLDWTQKIGDAFIGQQKQVMETVQKLRARAKEAGKLESSEQQTVTVQEEESEKIIVIESTSPDVIYIPAYNPAVVYGTWPYPAYPPYPAPHPVATAAVSFGVGVACGLAWGYAWGHCNWGHGDVNINVNQNINRNTNINRSNYTRNNASVRDGKGSFQHDPAHRGGVGYRDAGTAQRFGGTTSAQSAKAREAYRGRGEQPGAGAGPANRAGAGGAGTAGAGAGRAPGAAGAAPSNRGAFDGVSGGGAAARQESTRGQQSLGGSGGGASRGGGGRSGGGRGGGGRR